MTNDFLRFIIVMLYIPGVADHEKVSRSGGQSFIESRRGPVSTVQEAFAPWRAKMTEIPAASCIFLREALLNFVKGQTLPRPQAGLAKLPLDVGRKPMSLSNDFRSFP